MTLKLLPALLLLPMFFNIFFLCLLFLYRLSLSLFLALPPVRPSMFFQLEHNLLFVFIDVCANKKLCIKTWCHVRFFFTIFEYSNSIRLQSDHNPNMYQTRSTVCICLCVYNKYLIYPERKRWEKKKLKRKIFGNPLAIYRDRHAKNYYYIKNIIAAK